MAFPLMSMSVMSMIPKYCTVEKVTVEVEKVNPGRYNLMVIKKNGKVLFACVYW